mmetsp:Transcript_12454/g.20427  ORF Transcript_12454/g.20427 Transcript_12454/m.20427 type:complete len:245 (+) Transcript_12454:1220-1954(+)
MAKIVVDPRHIRNAFRMLKLLPKNIADFRHNDKLVSSDYLLFDKILYHDTSNSFRFTICVIRCQIHNITTKLNGQAESCFIFVHIGQPMATKANRRHAKTTAAKRYTCNFLASQIPQSSLGSRTVRVIWQIWEDYFQVRAIVIIVRVAQPNFQGQTIRTIVFNNLTNGAILQQAMRLWKTELNFVAYRDSARCDFGYKDWCLSRYWIRIFSTFEASITKALSCCCNGLIFERGILHSRFPSSSF